MRPRTFLPSRRHSPSSWVCSSLPELVALGGAVDDVLAAHRLEQLHPLGARHHADGGAAAVEHELDAVGADAAGGAPHEHAVALLHLGGVAADEHAVAGRGAQPVDRRLLPGEVLGLGHELVGLHDGQVGEAAEVRLEAPDALVGGEHRVVVGRRVLVVEVVAVHDDPVAGLPVAHRRADPQHDARRVGADDVVVEGVARAPHRLLAEPVEEPERGQRLEDRGPHRVEVDRATPSRRGTPRRAPARGWARRRRGATCAGPCPRTPPPPTWSARPAARGRRGSLGDGEGGDVLAGRAPLDGVEDVLHGPETY